VTSRRRGSIFGLKRGHSEFRPGNIGQFKASRSSKGSIENAASRRRRRLAPKRSQARLSTPVESQPPKSALPKFMNIDGRVEKHAPHHNFSSRREGPDGSATARMWDA
jgi:hypothetical protein